MLEYLQHQRHDNFWMWIWAVRECADAKLHTSFQSFLRDMQPNLILSSPRFTDIMHSFTYLAFDWRIQRSTSILLSPQFVSLSWIFLPQTFFPLPLPLSHHTASSLWPSIPLFLPISFFLCPPHHFFSSPLPSLIPHTKWRVTVCSCGFCPPRQHLREKLSPSHMHTDRGRDRHKPESFICRLYNSFKMELRRAACLSDAVQA